MKAWNISNVNESDRIQGLTLLASGQSVVDIACTLNCNRKTMISLMERLNTTGSIKDKPSSGRLKVTNVRTDQAITSAHVRNPLRTATSTALQYGISYKTAQRRFKNNTRPKLRRRPYIGQKLLPRHRRGGMLFSRRHLRWSRAQWGRVVFSDESPFRQSFGDYSVRVFRQRTTLQCQLYAGEGHIWRGKCNGLGRQHGGGVGRQNLWL